MTTILHGLPAPRAAGWRWAIVFAALAVLPAVGCRREHRPAPPDEHIDLADRDAPADSLSPLSSEELNVVADQIREVRRSRRPATGPDRKYTILAMSGGGAYGAYTAGVVCGWTETGTRPRFDVITGISTGSLVAALAFIGPTADDEIRRFYTQTTTEEVYEIRKPIRSLFSAYLADNTPLAEQIARTITPDYLRAVAAEHAAGRRLYVGSTNLNTRRLVVWDMGAIAARGTPEARDLYIDVLLASTAIPGFFPPVTFQTNVDGHPHEEVHVDGGVSRALFFRAPHVPPADRAAFGPASLHDSDLYLIVAGKLYPDPAPVQLKALSVAGSSISSLLYSSARAEVYRLFTYSILTGMNYYLAAVPADFDVGGSSVKFDPVEMTRLFEEGRREILTGTAWRRHPQSLDKSEDIRVRTGLNLTVPADESAGPKPYRAPIIPLTVPQRMPAVGPRGSRGIIPSAAALSRLVPGFSMSGQLPPIGPRQSPPVVPAGGFPWLGSTFSGWPGPFSLPSLADFPDLTVPAFEPIAK